MPKLQSLVLAFDVREATDQFGDFDFGLENLCSVVHVNVKMNCYGAMPNESEAAKVAIRNAISMNPNRPTLDICLGKKFVLKLDSHDDKDKKKAVDAVESLHGIDAISVDMKDQKLTVVGHVDPVDIMAKLRKVGIVAHIVSVGPAKE